MTLIVAKHENDKIYCLGDSKITYKNTDQANPFLSGCLKQYLIDDMMVGFAGDVASIESDFHMYKEARDCSEIIKIAEKYQKDKYEVITADNKVEKVYTIKNSITQESTVGFIGDSDAFSEYQKAYHQNPPIIIDPNHAQINIMQLPEPVYKNDTYIRMYNAFKNVIQNATVKSVDGVIVTIAKHKGKLQYMMYCDIYSDDVAVPEPGEERIINFGSIEGGGYSVEFSSNNEFSEIGTIPAYYFLQGGFGIVFQGNDNHLMRPIFLRAPSPCYWALETKNAIGESVISGYLSLDHCGIAGEEYLRANNNVLALKCYELRLDAAKKGNASRPKLDRYFAGYYVSYFNCGNQELAIKDLSVLVNDNPDYSLCARNLMKMGKEWGQVYV